MNSLSRKILTFLLLGLVPAGMAQNVLINEVMYHPAAGNFGESYVELYNSGTVAADVSGWRFSQGLEFTFPQGTVIGPQGYLVIAAQQTAFATRYPEVASFLAGWAAPMKSHIVLRDAAGNVINEIRYANEGDWAERILTAEGFAFYGHLGWRWHAAHDGEGGSLELVNSGLSSSYAHNWGASRNAGGTPGRANSLATNNAAPFIVAVNHAPVIPGPTDVVTISARIIDEQQSGSGVVASLYYREASTATPTAFTSTAMFDDGAHNDGLAGDGIYAAILPPQPEGTVIEFYLQTQDLQGNQRVYPKVIPPAQSLRTANLLYQVDSGSYAGSQPIYRIIMTEMERAELFAIGRKCPDSDSDAEMNATWISVDGQVTDGSTTQLRYNAGVRNRGHGTRQALPNNYHVNIPADRPWRGGVGINLNSQSAHSQVLGSAVFRRAGIATPESRAVQVRVNSTNLMSQGNNSYGSYAANEQYNNDFIQRAFRLDAEGNAYRGVRWQVTCDSSLSGVADFVWYGADYAIGAYTNAYFKENNSRWNDWSDLMDLIAVLNSANGYQASNYVQDVRRRINVEQWMRYMAANTILDNTETCLATGYGDDYGLYRGVSDTRFQALPYDQDSVMGRGFTPVAAGTGLFRMTALPVMDRFMKHPEFAPLYYQALKTLSETVFDPRQMNPFLDQMLGGYVPNQAIENMKAFNAGQVASVLARIPLSLTVSNTLPSQSGYARTTEPTAALFGAANAIETRTVLVNGVPASWVAWLGTWSAGDVVLRPGINRVFIQCLNSDGVEFDRAYTDIWYDDGDTQSVGGTIASDTTWRAAAGPYQISSSLTIANGASLTIEPGTTVYLGAGVDLTVANGGRLVAEGTPTAPIRFTVAPGSGASWGGITINGSTGSPETRIAHTFLEGNNSTCIEAAGGTLWLDHASFGTTTQPYLSLDGSSFVVSHCYFPTTSAPIELVHGTGGIKSGGRGIIRDCFFGSSTGYSDIIDFTGGNRPGPIIQFYNNVFIGTTDDHLDLDGTDAWIEGNIFLHCHKNGAPDSSSAVSGGNSGSATSEITVIGNIFYDCDQAATAKQGNFYTFLNNTIVRTTKEGGLDTDAAVVNVRDVMDDGEATTFAAGLYLEGNVVLDAGQLVRHFDPSQTTVTFNRNILPLAWDGPGAGNFVADPLLKHMPALGETYFTNWMDAQVVRDWFSLLPGSPARGTGPNGLDQGGVIPLGASISGVPIGTNNQTSLVVNVGPVRSGSGIPATAWPNGSGYTHYQWRLDGGVWSAETPTTTPIQLSGLANGPHHVEVIGKRDLGTYQNDADLGSDAVSTISQTWIVDTGYVPPATPTVRINEILAQNTTILTNAGATPDLIELYNYGSSPVDLAGLGLSDDPAAPHKFSFPPGTPLLAPGKFLVVYADSATGAPGIHLGFALQTTGEELYLYDRVARGGALLDAVRFGLQVSDSSIGRSGDGEWVLCQPTFGAENLSVAVARPDVVKINEWLADELFMANNDFVELFNPDSRPAMVGGCYFSDAEGSPALNPIAPLSFIAPRGHVAFVADGDPDQGTDHLSFKLSAGGGVIMLSDPALNAIDIINYGPQITDMAQGRSPSGSDTLASFAQPTAGGPNPVAHGGTTSVTNVTSTAVQLVDITSTWKYDNSGVDRGAAWYLPGFDDATWSSGAGLFGFETTPSKYSYPFLTSIPAPDQPGGQMTIYYRTRFTWDNSLTNVTLVSTNFIDDGAVYYLNGLRAGSVRMPNTVSYNTPASNLPNEGVPDILTLTNHLMAGENVLAVEVHQSGSNSSDAVFGMRLSAVQYATNVITAITGVPVVLNEVLASNRSFTNTPGGTSDYIELYNPTTNTLNLSDLSLSDDPDTPRKFVFAPGTTLPARGYLVIHCNADLPLSANNTGFALNASGDAVFLFGGLAQGGGLIDSLTFGLQTADFSLGRTPDGNGGWGLNVPTPGALNQAAAVGTAATLILNEWMADPVSGNDWFELFNRGSQPVALGGLFFTDDLTDKTLSPVAPLSFLGAGANGFVQFEADGDLAAGADHVNFRLSRSGETIGLFSPSGSLIAAATFATQMTGISQGRFPDGSESIVSFSGTSSPGEGNYLPLPSLVINEVLTHTDLPLEDAIEIHNSAATAANIGGWYISNSKDNLRKFRLNDGTLVPARGYAVIYEYQFNPADGSSVPFTLNSARGDQVYLSQADASGNLTGYRAVATFGASANGISFGRYTNSVGEVDFVALNGISFGVRSPATVEQFRAGSGAPNDQPLVGPVVIGEIMFQPPTASLIEDNTQDEYLELANRSAQTVPLFDPSAPTNTWRIRGGVDIDFPEGVSLAPGAVLLVVNFDPVLDLAAATEFRSRYQLSSSVPLFGPYGGNLANSGENIRLYRPDAPQLPPHPDAGLVPFILVEQVSYSATTPWPIGTSGSGLSLQRITLGDYGNDPVNWVAAAPTAGRPNTSNPGDANGDGLPDSWQIQHFGSINDPTAAPGADPDSDGFNNAQEYLAGTNPKSPLSRLRISSVALVPNGTTIQFDAVAGKTYSIMYSSDVGPGTWTKLADVPSQAQDQSVSVTDPAVPNAVARFYRLVTPQVQ